MKVTISQIEKALNNTFEFGIDGSEGEYNLIRNCEYEAILKIGSEIGKTSHYFTKNDWKKVYSEIKKMMK